MAAPKNLADFGLRDGIITYTDGINIATSQTGWFTESIFIFNFPGTTRITGNAFGDNKIGIDNAGTINTSSGNDEITGSAKPSTDPAEGITGINNIGIKNSGTFSTGDGSDAITGSATGPQARGINNTNTGNIHTGSGNDAITGNGFGQASIGIVNFGTIDTGVGKDTITGLAGVGGSAGIVNSGAVATINTGDGDDTITGNGIFNSGTINTGFGNDTIDALNGGFFGTGFINLDAGADTLKGFGTGTFSGGSGSDKILLGQGRYTISGSRITSGGVTMNVSSFEQIGGANGGLFNYGNGTFNVDQSGFMTKV